MIGLQRNVRLGLRLLRKSPGFASVLSRRARLFQRSFRTFRCDLAIPCAGLPFVIVPIPAWWRGGLSPGPVLMTVFSTLRARVGPAPVSVIVFTITVMNFEDNKGV